MATTTPTAAHGLRGDAAAAAPPVDTGLRDAVARHIRDDAELGASGSDRPALRRAVARALAAEGVVVAPAVWARMVRDLVDELAGLGPLEALLRDPAVTDVMVNGADEVHIERAGVLERVPVAFDDDAHLERTLRRVLGPVGARLDRAHPHADAVLEGGVRVHVILPPLARRPTVTLRRVPAVVPSWDELEAAGTLDHGLRDLLVTAVAERRNVVVCGRAGVGKTTLLARLLGAVGSDRVVVIEDAPELDAPTAHTVHLRVRPPGPGGAGGVDVAALLRNALRMRPDRLVVGEVRGPEVADMLQALNTGHAGSLTTAHANSARDALVRLEGMALLAGVPLAAVRAQLGTAIDLVVAMGRDEHGGRRIEAVCEIEPRDDGAPAVRAVWP